MVVSRTAETFFRVSEEEVVFKGFQELSLIDYPGKIAAVAFVGGCNFRCPYCYNPDLVLTPQNLPSLCGKKILEYLETHKEWLEGLVITGGEPIVHPRLSDFLEKVKGLGFKIKLDTNGSNSKLLAELIRNGLVDYVALDVKAPLVKERYREFVGPLDDGRVLEEVKNSVALLKDSGEVDYEFRTTVVPRILSEEDIFSIVERIKGAKRYYLQQFKPTRTHVDKSFSEVRPYPPEVLHRIQRMIAPNFGVCKVRG